MNSVSLLGRTTADIELKTTQSGKSVVSFSLAVKRPYTKDISDFYTIVAWEKQAENIARYVSKGQMIAILGHLQTRSWTDKNGNKRVETEVVADSFYFCEGKAKATSSDSAAEIPPDYEEFTDDLENPF